jgi:tetratricopeptide (TPR) repeat protein
MKIRRGRDRHKSGLMNPLPRPTKSEDPQTINPAKRGGLIGRLIERLFGYDVFLSYTRQDDPESQYANALFVRLTGDRPRLRCFLDVKALNRDETLHAAIAGKVRATRFLVILAGPAAGERPSVIEEAQLAVKLRKRVMLIDRGIGWDASTSRLKSIVNPLSTVELNTAAPSTEVVASIRKHVGIWRVDVQRRLAIMSAFGVVLILAGAIFLLYRDAESNFRLAKESVDETFSRVEFDLQKLPGAEAYRLELLKRARSYYTEFLRRRGGAALDLDHAKTILNLGLIELELGGEAGPQFAEATRFLTKAIEKNPNDFELQRHLFLSQLNVGVSFLSRNQPEKAESPLRTAISFGEQIRQTHPGDLKLVMDTLLAKNNLGTSLLRQNKLEEGVRLMDDAKAGFQSLRQKIGQAGVDDAPLRDELDSHIAGAFFNLAGLAGAEMPLTQRIDNNREAWRLFEDLFRRDTTSNERAFRVAQVCHLMAVLLLDSGDAGDAEIYAERSFLIRRKLAKLFMGNTNYGQAAEADRIFLTTHSPIWRQDLWFHEGALKALERVNDLGLPMPDEGRGLKHRVSIAHLAIAISLLKPMLLGQIPTISQEDSLRARSELERAKSLNEELLKTEKPGPRREIYVVMKLNYPMWLELCP